MKEWSHVKISNIHKEILHKLLAVSVPKYEKEYLEAAIIYFKDTGLDPTEKVQSLSGEVKKMKDTIISFYKTQEKLKLNPMVNNIDELTKTFIEYLSENAPTKNDLQLILDKLDNPKIENKPVIQKSDNQEAHKLFMEFVGKMSSGINKYTVEKKTVEHYKNLFNGLN
jgi:hypothetical protein